MSSMPPDQWRTSSRTKANDPQCVEARLVRDVVHVRDTKAKNRGFISVGKNHWDTIISAIKNGDLDLDT